MSLAPRLSDIPEVLTSSALWTLLGRLEHEQLDFKRQVSDLTSILPAMAMTTGGLIVVGIDNRRHVIGALLDQRAYDKTMRAAADCDVEVQVKPIVVDGKDVFVIAVPEVTGRVVTTPDGRLLRRIGSDNKPLRGDVLARFVREREDRSAEDEVVALLNPDDLDLQLVNTVLAADGRPPVKRTELVRALVDLNLAIPQPPPADPAVTKAAAILFARDPRKEVPGASVQLVRRLGVGPGPGPTSARVEVAAPLPMAVDEALAFIREHTRRYEVVIGSHRDELGEYPESVLREALLNALGHRDYGMRGTTVDVTIWDDRLEIRSPGSLPAPVTVDTIRTEHYSRNRRVMRTLKLMGLVEEYGEGVDRMYAEMEARLMEPPQFDVSGSSVTVRLMNRFQVSVEDQAWLALLGHLQLSTAERRALVVTRREGQTTRRRLRSIMPGEDIDGLLRRCVAKGLLIRVGQRAATRYVLSDEIVLRAGSTGVEAQQRKRQTLLDEMRSRGSLSTLEGAEILGEDLILVRHLLNDLVLAGLAEARGRTRARRYYPV